MRLTSITCLANYTERWKQSINWERYFIFICDRHSFVKLKRSVLLIQRAARTWINQTRHGRSIAIRDVSARKSSCGWSAGFESVHGVAKLEKPSNLCEEKGASDLQTKVVVKIQLAWKNFVICRSLRNQHFAATKIQSHFLGWLLRRRFLNQRQATIKIQSSFRMKICWSAYQHYKIATISATLIQSFVRGWIARRGACRCRHLIVAIQVCCLGFCGIYVL